MSSFENVIREHGILAFTVLGVSMEPLIKEKRDIAVIRRVERPLRKYDVVLFWRPSIAGDGDYVLHRILRDNGDGTFYIVGDNCVAGDTVRCENIFGLMTALRRNGRTIEVDQLGYRLYVRVWWAAFPFRKAYRRVRSLAGRAKRKLLS